MNVGRLTFRLTLGLALLTCDSRAAEQDPETSEAAPPQVRSIDELPWPVRPGMRIAGLRGTVPTVDRVVLVPDEASYLHAISEWSLKGRWPVLFEDDVYAPMFIRRFKPMEVVRKSPASTPAPRGESLEQAMLDAVSASWRSDVDADASTEPPADLQARFEQANWTPPGVVITSSRDPAWPAGLALAADRGQPLVFLDERYGSSNGQVAADDWPRLNGEIEALVASTGYPYKELGDAIDTITIVRELPVKYIPRDDPSGKGRNAVTDGLGRNADNLRWAFAGWIFGDAPQATYMAMCSIFLQPDSALLFDTYPASPGWSRYAMDRPAAQLRDIGYNVEHIAEPGSSATTWERLAPGGLHADLILVNTKGNQNWFDAAGDSRVFVHDVPILNAPAMVHFIHSWSCIQPANRKTLAGRWIERGAYAYVGSVHEPTLSAFVPPELLVERLRASIPFLIASRVWETTPWRVATIGDPLMTLLRPVPRAQPDAHPITGANLRELLRTAVDEAEQSGDWTEPTRLINWLGLDPLTFSVYQQRLNDRASAETIALAFGAVFRNGDAPTLLHAIEQIPLSQVTPAQRDMLWLKWLPTLNTIDTVAQLNLMREHIRTPWGYLDGCRLAPLMRSMGQRDLINGMLDQYEDDIGDNYSRQLVKRARQ